MNLLNGLAVSDTAVIRDKAEIVTYQIRVDTISCFEAVLLGDPFNFLSNWPAIRYLQVQIMIQPIHDLNQPFSRIFQAWLCARLCTEVLQ